MLTKTHTQHFTKIIFDADCIDGGNVNYVLLCLARHYYFPFDVCACVWMSETVSECESVPFHTNTIFPSPFFRELSSSLFDSVVFVHANTFFLKK